MKLLFERGSAGRRATAFPPLDVDDPGTGIPADRTRAALPIPDLSEIEVVRHFTELSANNYGIDTGIYPLGSCTMKYNPRRNEAAASLPGFSMVHPLQPETTVQGCLKLMYDLEKLLCGITGMDAATLEPAAGAHGEVTSLMMVKAYYRHKGEERTKVIVPDTSHGTNPASIVTAGFNCVEVKSDARGNLDLETLGSTLDEDTAAVMVTNPTTLGLFEENIVQICELVHDAGAVMYLDGANMNALLGVARPRDMGFDIMHLNLHKTFSTPHGGGGPGSGPVAVSEELAPFLPIPSVVKEGDTYRLDHDRPLSIGKVRSFHGSFSVLVRAYAYIRTLGPGGLREVSEGAVLAANYLKERLKGTYELPYDRVCMHEFVLSGSRQLEKGVNTMDVAKRLMDYGFHPPTVYFPLIVKEALMVEPTETEPLEILDAFADAMLAIADECDNDPEMVKGAPHTLPVKKLDGVLAARRPDVTWRPE